jgi:hypothetical protein
VDTFRPGQLWGFGDVPKGCMKIHSGESSPPHAPFTSK